MDLCHNRNTMYFKVDSSFYQKIFKNKNKKNPLFICLISIFDSEKKMERKKTLKLTKNLFGNKIFHIGNKLVSSTQAIFISIKFYNIHFFKYRFLRML